MSDLIKFCTLEGASIELLVSELDKLHSLTDSIYAVRTMVVGEPDVYGEHSGRSWDHPVVKRYHEILKRISAKLDAAGVKGLE